ncbi:hypothetical protein G7Y89_g571 [Cudoniella acicularis]|uniref:Uncharacterized protein n=1 Tax=Cudoniella acicularis TaxID=354080 RepID=A0A8H4WB28_9HELO|nr:hypothetical protein G7Y89_g571 [Cudoniella acicularis]
MTANPFMPPKKGKGKDSSEVNEKHEFKFRLTTIGNCLGGLGANAESRQETLRLNPDFIRFRGPKIFFDAKRNFIHFDKESLHSLWLYSLPKNFRNLIFNGHPPTGGKRLIGFNNIKKISVSRPINHARG